jgi:hypothetical protein
MVVGQGAAVVQFAAVEADYNDCCEELEGAKGGAKVDSCEAGFVPVLLEGGAFGGDGFGRHGLWRVDGEVIVGSLDICEYQAEMLWWFALWCLWSNVDDGVVCWLAKQLTENPGSKDVLKTIVSITEKLERHSSIIKLCPISICASLCSRTNAAAVSYTVKL